MPLLIAEGNITDELCCVNACIPSFPTRGINLYFAHMDIIPITTLDLPELRLYVSMKGKPFPYADTFFVAEGEKLVDRLLQSDYEIVSVLLSPKWLEKYREQLATRCRKGTPVFLGEEELLATITGFAMHHSIMAIARVPEPIDIPQHLARRSSPRVIVALDGIVDAENMGGIVRNCAAFGVDLLIYAENCCSPYLRRAARVSMGGIFAVPMVRVHNLAETLSALHGRIIATYLDHGSAVLHEATFKEDVCLVFGNEGDGISDEVLIACSERMWIPMATNSSSLNIATACGIFLHEVVKGRKNACA